MSMNFNVDGTILPECSSSASTFSRGSGTEAIPVLGSMVQNGKFAASAPPLLNALNNVDLPTLGNPTKPQEKLMMSLCEYSQL